MKNILVAVLHTYKSHVNLLFSDQLFTFNVSPFYIYPLNSPLIRAPYTVTLTSGNWPHSSSMGWKLVVVSHNFNFVCLVSQRFFFLILEIKDALKKWAQNVYYPPTFISKLLEIWKIKEFFILKEEAARKEKLNSEKWWREVTRWQLCSRSRQKSFQIVLETFGKEVLLAVWYTLKVNIWLIWWRK